MIRRPPRSTLDRSSAASDVYKRQAIELLNSEDDMIPIKILQIVLIMTNHEDILKPPMATKVVHLCLKAFNNNSQIIRGNVFTILKQMYTCLLYTSPSPRD
eukprot:TRINITY_DN8937_c0_g1_i8.p1 TRINITY_DN8937_c0_g1~~TRINITY_DN8937_c0_g1_i8.p1  ORF type:complete len:108 (+),score=32.04 TRINITY_DN8937_c0_g1_i8:23-325(+)